jgi:hypothetical protein
MATADDPEKDGSARYAFAVRFQLNASASEWRADTRTVERTCYREAAPPGEPGWLFFRDHLWRGKCNHPEHLSRLVGEAFDLPVEGIEFRGLRTDEAYFTALKEEIATDLALFNADSTAEVIKKYLGSSIQVNA